jgi:hypothetical protein
MYILLYMFRESLSSSVSLYWQVAKLGDKLWTLAKSYRSDLSPPNLPTCD